MMKMEEILKVFAPHRGDAIVISGRANRHWDKISTNKNRDLSLGDPAMGGHASFALGLALARPKNKVVLFDSEGDLQMSLSSLSMVAEQAPKNFVHFVLDNECYATTGGQPVPNASRVHYDQLALGAGYGEAHSFDNLETFSINVERILAKPGPVFVALKIKPEIINVPIGSRRKWNARSAAQCIIDMKKEIGIPV